MSCTLMVLEALTTYWVRWIIFQPHHAHTVLPGREKLKGMQEPTAAREGRDTHRVSDNGEGVPECVSDSDPPVTYSSRAGRSKG